MKETKSRLFVRPIGHIKRHVVPTSSAISHINEPSFFQQNDQHEHSHYRTEFKMKTNDGNIGKQRLSSPNRRNKPHPVEVYHLQRLRSGLVCDVRTKLPINSLNNNILGISPLSPSSELSSWTKTVYKAYDWKALAHVAESKIRRFPAIGIVPTCLMTSKTSDDAMKKEDHWLPGSLKLTTPLSLRGIYEYFPRKRKLIFKGVGGAGVTNTKDLEHRFYDIPRRRGKQPAKMTVRAGI